jgi:membrane-associated phospholipid phosphatase
MLTARRDSAHRLRLSVKAVVNRRPTWFLAIALGGVLIVLVGVVSAGWSALISADTATAVAADTAVAAHPSLVVLVKLVTDAGSPVSIDLLTLLVAAVLLIRRRTRAAIYVAVVRGLELGLETLLKVTVDRPRPSVPTVLTTAQGMSFPSGHTAGTAAFCASLFILARSVLTAHGRLLAMAAAVVAVVAVAASRVLLGVHYPSDVVGGAVLGVLCAVVLSAFVIRERQSIR